MACIIGIEDQKKLRDKVFLNLTSMLDANKPLDIDAYMNDVYDLLTKANFDLERALSFVQLLPGTINTITKLYPEIRKHLTDTGFSFDKLYSLEDKFQTLPEVANYMGKTLGLVANVKDVIDQHVKISNEPGYDLASIQKELTVPEFFVAKPFSMFTTTGQEAIDLQTNIPDPKKAAQYTFQRDLINKLYTEEVNNDSRNLIGIMHSEGLYLSAISTSKISVEHLENNSVAGDDLVMAITDIRGQLLYYDELGKETLEDFGKPMLYKMRTSTDSLASYSAIAKQLTKHGQVVTAEQAQKIIEDQLTQLTKIREYIKKDPKRNFVKTFINGGKLGYIKFGWDIKTPLSAVNFTDNPLELFVQKSDSDDKKLYKGAVYFKVKGVQDPILLQRNPISTSLAAKLTRMIVDKVYKKTPSGEKIEMTPEDKKIAIKQYLHGSESFILTTTEDKKELLLILEDKVIDLKADNAFKIIYQYLTNVRPFATIPENKLTSAQKAKAIDQNNMSIRQEIKDGDIVKIIDKSGNTVYQKWGKVQFNLNGDYLNNSMFDDYILETNDTKSNLYIPNPIPYYDWLKKNTYINYETNAEGKLTALNSYFSYQIDPAEMTKIYPLQEAGHIKAPELKVVDSSSGNTQIPVEQAKSFIERVKNNPKLNKTVGQHLLSLPATQQQIVDALNWYTNSPLSKHFPFEALFNQINTANPKSIATWEMHGITLYKGANYSDLYHEAWHGFTQGLMTKAQKIELYKELGKRSGSFVNHEGRSISFKAARPLELEEFLAEDFRKYMLSGGKTISKTSPIKNEFFRKIWNFLKALFGNSTVDQIMIDERSIATIHDLYQKLKIGNINEFTFDASNADFSVLNKGLEAIDKTDPIPHLKTEDSMLAVETIDSIFSGFVDMMNSGLSPDDQTILNNLENNKQVGIKLTPAEETRLNELKALAPLKRYTSKLLTTVEGRNIAYEWALSQLINRKDILTNQLKKEENPTTQLSIQRSLDLLNYMINNYGDTSDPTGIKQNKGLIYYHNKKSKYLTIEDRSIDQDDDTSELLKSHKLGDRSGNESSIQEMANKEILYQVKSLYFINKEGDTVKNRLGFNKLCDFSGVMNRLIKILAGSMSPQEMEQRLVREQEAYPIIKQLLAKLGDSSVIEGAQFNLWNAFYQTFNLSTIQLQQMTLNKTEDGTYESKIGEASADYRKVGRLWDNLFSTALSSPYIKRDSKGVVSLDIAGVLAKYKTVVGREWEFFNDIGIALEDNDDIRRELSDKDQGGAKYIRIRLQELLDRGIFVNNIKAIFKAYPATKSHEALRDNNNRFKQLQQVQTRYSEQFSNFSVTNAESNSQYTQSLNNTMTVMLNAINKAESFQDLMNNPEFEHMRYLDMSRNVFAKHSKWLNSIFDIRENKKRRDGNNETSPYVTLNIDNISGVMLTELDNTSDIGGISSASADQFTKFLMDFHYQIQRGATENVKHSDKSTAYSTTVSKINSQFSKNPSGKFYIGIENFKPTSTTQETAIYESVVPYLYGEHERVLNFRNAKPGDTIYNTPDYHKNGKDFVWFDRVLSDKTKEKLYELDIPVEEYLKETTKKAATLKADINQDIQTYFADQFKEVADLYNQTPFVADNFIKTIREAADDKFIGIQNAQIVDMAQKTFVMNNWIHNAESIIMIYGDIAQYKTDKEEFHKRNSAFGSTGRIFRTDDTAMEYVNQIMGMGYAKANNLPIKTFTTKLQSAVLEDPTPNSVYYDQIRENFEKDIRARYLDNYKNWTDKKGNKISKDQIEKLIIKAVDNASKPYLKMKIGDAQGWATFDSYRALCKLQDDWTKQQEELYQKIVKKEYVNMTKVTTFFPIKKWQYAGPLDTKTGAPVMANHKFSVMPLIPTVIEGTRLEELHNKMVAEGTDYALFASGSKITTLTNQGEMDKFYSDLDTRTLDTKKITPNSVFLQYFKNQLETGSDFKGEVIFSTQLRKLIEEGLVEGGIPTDYNTSESLDSRRASWSNLAEVTKLKESPRYKLYKTYENNIKILTELRKKELKKEAGWDKDKPGAISKLISLVKKELTRQDLAEHELEFIDAKPNSNEPLHDLSISLSAEKIEKILVALVNRRLIRQKINGEGLIQASVAGFEKGKFTKPTEEDKLKYGTNDLPSYYKSKNGNTTAAKVKIALQGEFTKLLQLEHPEGGQIGNLERLNSLLKNEAWLDTDDHRQMVTIVGVRIPVQGLNSMEFAEVYDFLPPEAGNIIIAPAEIVAKAGSDFDIDKLTMMMPNLSIKEGKVTLFKQYSVAEARTLYDKIVEKKVKLNSLRDLKGNIVSSEDPAVDDLLSAIFGNVWEREFSEQEIKEILEEENVESFPVFLEKLNGSKAVENDLLRNMRDILQLPENYSSLVRPNDTDIVKPIADNLADDVTTYNPKANIHTEAGKTVSGSRVLEYQYNLYKHMSNNIGKQVLGMGAVDNSYNIIFNRTGAYMNPTAGLTQAQYDAGVVRAEILEKKGEAKQTSKEKTELLLLKKDLAAFRKQTIYLPHNSLVTPDGPAISLSNIMDKENRYKISDIISQAMNGWVDVAKDSWIFNIQGNKEVTPVLLFMVQAGVPIEHAVYFVSQPLVREYVNEQRLAKSTFAGPLGKAPSNPNFFRFQATTEILTNPKYGFNYKGRTSNIAIYQLGAKLIPGNLDAFEKKYLYDNIKTKQAITDKDRAVFLHYLEIENMSKAIRDIKMNMNFDTKKDPSFFDARNRELKITQLKLDNRTPTSTIDNILNESPIGSFNIQNFIFDLFQPLFPLRTSKNINEFLLSKMRDRDISTQIAETFGDPEKFSNAFLNDLVSYIFQNSLRKFTIQDTKEYKGYNTDDTTPVEKVPLLKFGAFVKEGVLYYDMNQLITDQQNQNYTKDEYQDRGLAKLSANTFRTAQEYYNFVFEREYQRSIISQANLVDDKNMDFLLIKGKVIAATPGYTDEQATRLAYEVYLRNKALDNIGNPWKLFESDYNYAETVEQIKAAHPQLLDLFSVLKVLTPSQAKGASSMKNLQLMDTMLDSDKINKFHENLLSLSNQAEVQEIIGDPIEAQRIADIFKRFAMVAFLQSGLSTKGAFSLVRLVPTDRFTRMMEGPAKEAVSGLTQERLESFYNQFIINNISKTSRFRYKDYTRIAHYLKSSGRAGLQSYELDGNIIYIPANIGPKIAETTVIQNPDVVYVYNASIDPKKQGGGETNDAALRSGPTLNKLGFPTRLAHNDSMVNALTDTTFDKNKALIDEAINNLIELKNSGMILGFNANGYGQSLIGYKDNGSTVQSTLKPGRKTFVYLSEQLFKNFGFINNNYNRTIEAVAVLAEGSPVTDKEIKVQIFGKPEIDLTDKNNCA